MITPVDAQVMGQMANSSVGSSAGGALSFAMPDLPDPDPAAAKMFAQTMNGSTQPQSVNPADTDTSATKAGATDNGTTANISDINLPPSVKFFTTVSMEDLFRLRKTVGEWEYQQIRTDKFSELTGQTLDSATKQSE